MQSQLEPTCKTHWTHVPKCLKIEISCHTAMSKRHVYWKPFSLALAATIQQDLPNLLLLFSYSVVSNSFVTPMGCSPPVSSLHGIFQARILEWVAISSSRGSSWPRDQTRVSCIAGWFLTLSYQGSPLCVLLQLKKKTSLVSKRLIKVHQLETLRIWL